MSIPLNALEQGTQIIQHLVKACSYFLLNLFCKIHSNSGTICELNRSYYTWPESLFQQHEITIPARCNNMHCILFHPCPFETVSYQHSANLHITSICRLLSIQRCPKCIGDIARVYSQQNLTTTSVMITMHVLVYILLSEEELDIWHERYIQMFPIQALHYMIMVAFSSLNAIVDHKRMVLLIMGNVVVLDRRCATIVQ